MVLSSWTHSLTERRRAAGQHYLHSDLCITVAVICFATGSRTILQVWLVPVADLDEHVTAVSNDSCGYLCKLYNMRALLYTLSVRSRMSPGFANQCILENMYLRSESDHPMWQGNMSCSLSEQMHPYTISGPRPCIKRLRDMQMNLRHRKQRTDLQVQNFRGQDT